MIRKFLIPLVLLPASLLGGLFGLMLLSVSFEPMMVKQSFSRDAFLRAEQWLGHVRNAFEQDQLNRITLDSQDISDLAYYAASSLKFGGKKVATLEGIKTEFGDKKAITRMTLRLNQVDKLYLNVTFSFSVQEGHPHWDFAQVGGSYWPGNILAWGMENIVFPLLPEQQGQVLAGGYRGCGGDRCLPGQDSTGLPFW